MVCVAWLDGLDALPGWTGWIAWLDWMHRLDGWTGCSARMDWMDGLDAVPGWTAWMHCMDWMDCLDGVNASAMLGRLAGYAAKRRAAPQESLGHRSCSLHDACTTRGG